MIDIDSYKKGEKVYCEDESMYSQHLTKRKQYLIFEVGTDLKEGKLRIKGNSNRLVWIPESFFSKNQQPTIKSICMDDEIENPQNDYVEITVTFSNNYRGWFRIATLNYIKDSISISNKFFMDRNVVIVNEILKERIEAIIHELDLSNQLVSLLLPYK